jgi:hypothetical protein
MFIMMPSFDDQACFISMSLRLMRLRRFEPKNRNFSTKSTKGTKKSVRCVDLTIHRSGDDLQMDRFESFCTFRGRNDGCNQDAEYR